MTAGTEAGGAAASRGYGWYVVGMVCALYVLS